ncbi:MAG: ZIP family metal transporter [Chloroflexi bacterium]|jgi:ZIP family zinc transporter|nr:ZIP family metal transporter [Anaerolineaceae bacterium]NLI44946.1 ZIP family metal transporter [Chloroflexota bacterium]HOE35261.1 ZIP family metal transporter [Anaerolineaceae bacterium]HOT26097.1 ZIP family metal transporter [Anaerolineaceae bacterium]HQK03988.1 ZIP family metal transporter [Anaerolineaceae bacterium]
MNSQLPPLVNVLLLSLVASLGTGIGGLIAVIRRPGRRSFGFLMGITAGVMICLAFLELVNEAWNLGGPITATLGFGFGACFMFLLDYLAPHMRFGEVEFHGAHSAEGEAEECVDLRPRRMWRFSKALRRSPQRSLDHKLISSGILLAIGITLHNLPEGIAVGAGYMHNPQFGLFVALAIMLHNIPEGLATALPLCKGGIRRRDALRVAFLSGFAEPVGALLASLFLVNFSRLIPAALAFAGGVMVFITLDELIPSAREYGHVHWTSLGIILGSLFVFVLSALLGV